MNTSTHFIFSRMGIAFCLILALLVGCGSDSGDSETVSDVSGVSVAALDPSIAADGVSFTVIRAVVSVSGVRSPQGTMVYFHTTHGTIPAAATANHDGVANARLTSSTYEGTAVVTATAGTSRATVNVEFTRSLIEPANVELLVSNPQIASSGSDQVTLTAVVKDRDNTLIPGVDVRFTADNAGTVRIIRSTSDESGTAEAVLSAEGNKANRTINLWARARGVEAVNKVDVVGTHIAISGAETGVVNGHIRLTVALRDSDGSAIGGKMLTASSSAGNIIDYPSQATNSGGNVTFNVNTIVPGNDTITVAGEGAMAARELRIFNESLVFQTPVLNQDVALNLSIPVIVRLTDAAGIPREGVTVHFSATRGALSAPQAVTDALGDATVFIAADNAGASTITASVANGPSVQVEIMFVAIHPRHLNLQAVPAVIGTNRVGEDSSRSTIHAVLRDPNHNLVKNQIIDFNLVDISGGRLTHSFATTDEYGRASTDYVAGAMPSAFDNVVVNAVVRGWPAVTASVALTVAERAVNIKLGTGNLIVKPDPAEPQKILYYLPYSVLVTDITGGPVRNAELTLTLWPESYAQGFYYRVYDGDTFKYWAQQITRGPIPNEDVNRNGILDPGEDVNNNGRLDPGHVATIQPHPDYTISTTPIKVRTDDSGFAFFEVIYAQEYANWVNMELTARTRVAGTEASALARFTLPILGEDITQENVAPPGAVSPFGPGPSAPIVINDIFVRAGSPILGANGISNTVIRAFVSDISGGPAPGVSVNFHTTLGSISPTAITDQFGMADAVLTSAPVVGTAVVTATAGGFSDNVQVQFIMIPPGQTAGIAITASAATILADGNQTTTIIADLIDGAGLPAPIGTPVRFTTTHGTFPNGSRTYDAITQDGSGRIQVILTAGLTPGRAEITCKSFTIEAMTFVQMEFPR